MSGPAGRIVCVTALSFHDKFCCGAGATSHVGDGKATRHSRVAGSGEPG